MPQFVLPMTRHLRIDTCRCHGFASMEFIDTCLLDYATILQVGNYCTFQTPSSETETGPSLSLHKSPHKCPNAPPAAAVPAAPASEPRRPIIPPPFWSFFAPVRMLR